jgi:predicted AAA+ superfamily ATPase
MQEIHILQILLGEFYDKLESLKDLVIRDAKFPKATNKIKVAVGMRRVGKTYFIYQEILKLIDAGASKTCILYINFEDDRLLPLDQQKLAKLVDAFYALYPENHERKCYLFFDEIQNVNNWPLVIRRLFDSKKAEIFLTGSSAKLLSKEIATNLRGRSLAIEIWPYSFSEFMRAKKIVVDRRLYDKKAEDKLKQYFHRYLSEGGFPEVLSYDQDLRMRTLQDYVDVVIYRDIIERHNIKNPALIKYMILSMIHNVSKPFTINKFYNDIRSQGYKVGKDILYEYADHIEDTYLAFSIPIYDKSVRKIQTNPKKLYAIDTAMVRAMTLNHDSDLGRLFENIIFLDLKRAGYTIKYYLTTERYEIDFLVQTPRGHQKFLQVVWQQEGEKTIERESRALEAGMKELKIDGEIITIDSYLREGLNLFNT